MALSGQQRLNAARHEHEQMTAKASEHYDYIALQARNEALDWRLRVACAVAMGAVVVAEGELLEAQGRLEDDE